MYFFELFTPEGVLFFPDRGISTDKEELIKQLCETAAKDWEAVTAEKLKALVEKREATLTTRLGPELAIPHAVIPGVTESRVCMAILENGICWDREDERPVRLVILLAGGEENHLSLLSSLARLLQDEGFFREILASSTGEEVFSLFHRRETVPAEPFFYGRKDLSATILEKALELCRSIEGARLVLHADALDDASYIEELSRGKELMVVAPADTRFSSSFMEKEKPVLMPFRGVKRSAHVQLTLLYLLGKELIGRDDLVINVFGKPGSGFLDSLRLSHLARELELPFAAKGGDFPRQVELPVFARVLQLASQLSLEGREGKPVGTLFVLGDREGLSSYIRQMIANPFHGYTPGERNILDPGLEETVKEYAKIDGAFIISGDGTIESAGTFLSGQPTAEEMQSGLGARHAAAQGISAVSKATAIAISESTRKITVFQAGRRLMEL